MYDKFKGIVSDDVCFYGALIVCVAVASFGLGRLSADSPAPQQIGNTIVMSQTAAPVAASGKESSQENAPAGGFVASKNGTKYHALWCPGAQQIKEENKVFFDTKEEARAAGYTPAGNCKGI